MKPDKYRATKITLIGVLILILSIIGLITADGFDAFGAVPFAYVLAPATIIYGLFIGLKDRHNSKKQNYILIGTLALLIICASAYTVSRKMQSNRSDYCDNKYPVAYPVAYAIGGEAGYKLHEETRLRNIRCGNHEID